jgi:hypothetical protein
MDEKNPLKEIFVSDLNTLLIEFKNLSDMLLGCIEMDKAKQNDYILKPGFSPDLAAINADLTKAKRKLE